MWIICFIYGLVSSQISQIPCLETTVINLVSDALVACQVMVVHHHVDASLCRISVYVGIVFVDVVIVCLVKLVLPVFIFHIFIIGGYRCSVGSTTIW